MNGYARNMFNALQIQTRIDRQFVKLRHTNSAVCPAFNAFINGFTACNVIGAHGQNVNHFAVQLITCAKLQLMKAIEHVEREGAYQRINGYDSLTVRLRPI